MASSFDDEAFGDVGLDDPESLALPNDLDLLDDPLEADLDADDLFSDLDEDDDY
jgi:hypothetical protein